MISLGKQGVLYIATGEKYIRAAMVSAQSVIKYSPGLPIHIYADWQNYNFDFDKNPSPFTSTGKIAVPHRRSKIDYLHLSPFNHTLYLDTDTLMNTDIRTMFQILDRFDIAMCHAHWRRSFYTTRTWKTMLPDSFPQFNSGVILYRNSKDVLNFFNEWQGSYIQANFPQDQITLRELLWFSNLRIVTLPPEYNVRFMKYHFLWSKSEAKTKIFHLQKFHDGPFWFLKVSVRKVIRTVLSGLGIDSVAFKKWIRNDPNK